jgi:hypothetical protein
VREHSPRADWQPPSTNALLFVHAQPLTGHIVTRHNCLVASGLDRPRGGLGLEVFEVPVQVAQRLPVDLLQAEGLAEKSEGGHSLRNHSVLVDHG